MKITPLTIDGAFLIEQEPYKDERGYFARQFCKKELAARGLDFDIRQCNVSLNLQAGTLRGLHYQKEPFPEIKLVSCFRGAAYDVLADIRPNSPTYLQWTAVELSQDNAKTVYVPAGVAHGFQTLKDDTLIYYQLSEFFMPDYYAGVRWNDPKLGIVWPECDCRIINERDAAYELIK